MKPHLPCLLLSALMAAMASVATAGYMHGDASLLTYTDFGQNMGRYSVGNTNALLDYINRDGVKITYTGGQADYTMEHGMIDFSSQCDGGYGAAIGYNFYTTVQHNGVHNNTYTANYLGNNYAIHYQGIEYRSSSSFLITTNNDYKVTRQSKLITDVTGSTVYGSVTGDYSGLTDGSLKGQILYRSGSGTMGKYDTNGNGTGLCGAYSYSIGAMQEITGIGITNSTNGAISVHNNMNTSSAGVNDRSPLPYAARSGDSGSPAWVWNEDTGQYEYIAALQSGDVVCYSQYRGGPQYTAEAMAAYYKNVAIGSDHTVYINAVTTAGESVTDGTYTATPYSGTVTNASGTVLTNFVGVKSGIQTWKDLSGLKDTENWYSYGNEYLNANSGLDATKDGVLNYADLYMTENLVFTAASSSETQKVILNADVDLGLGYAQFSKGEGQESTSFTISSVDGNNYLLNSAGYVVDAGVDLHLKLTNPAEYMREWRKIGAGNLYIEGTGNNDVFLNVGGSGAEYGGSTTYLERETGYAAYNVLANNGATVVIKDINQIKRDFTFGFRGGYLDMNGNSMTWNNDNAADAEGFTIHALDEGARITNGGSENVTLTWTQGGEQTWLGSFTDQSGKGAVRFIYNGGDGAVLTMRSIYTDLSHVSGSGITVQSGTLALEGTNTIHGMGSLNGKNSNRYSSEDDWHYADVKSAVEVQSGGTLQLGSHARWTGDVTVKDGGTFVMNEGVRHQYEYIEGGQVKENTDLIRDFFGLKGNVSLESGAAMKVQFSEGTDSKLAYSGNITGAGSFSADLGTNSAQLILSGNNTFSGIKEVLSGTVVIASDQSMGDLSVNKWQIADKGAIALMQYGDDSQTDTILSHIDGSSTGVLALTSDIENEISLDNHKKLIIGALEGHSVHYGTAGIELTAIDGKWTLGGGGGSLIVDFKLMGDNQLVLGNEYGKGNVILTNTANNFTGDIILAGGVTLDYTDAAALGNSNIRLDYTNRILVPSHLDNINSTSTGVLLLDRVENQDVDLSSVSNAYLGSQRDVTYTGNITLADGADYRFGGMTGILTVESSLQAGRDLIVDGQTYSGGKLVLNQASNDFNGAVSVMGWDSSQTSLSEGSISLGFGEDNVLAHASSVSVSSGGIIDLSGTVQTLNNLSTSSGGNIVDTVGGGTLNIVSSSDASLSGSLNVDNIEKTGSATLTLNGSNTYESFKLKEGKVVVGSSSALCSSGTFHVVSGSTLDVGTCTVYGDIVLNSGTLSINKSSDSWNTGKVYSDLYIQGSDNVIKTVGSNATTLYGNSIGMAEGASLLLSGNWFILNSSTIGAKSSTITFSGAILNFDHASNVAVNSSLVLKGSRDVQINARGTSNNSLITFNRLEASLGLRTLTLKETNKNTIYTIHELAGESNIIWDSQLNFESTSRMILDGEGSFSGDLTLQRGANNGGDRVFQSFIELQHNLAVQNATISLTGGGSVDYASLAVNTADAHMKGLNSTNAQAWVFAGAASTNSSSTTATAPNSTRQARLTITGGGSYEYKGGVGSDAGTGNGITLVMDGSGTQTFSGSSITLNGVEAKQGTLNLNTAGLNILGDISLVRGATVQMGTVADGTFTANGTYTLDTGHSLIVTEGGVADSSANLNASLCLAGGTLTFSGNTLTSDSAALNVSGDITVSDNFDGQTIRLSETSSLTAGTYQLASGNWSNLDSSSITTTLDYMDATFVTSADGLTMTLQSKDGYVIWDGTDSAHTWSTSAFGHSSTIPGASDTAVFNDSSLNRNVQITSSASVRALLFDTTGASVLTTENNSELTAGTLQHIGTGTTTLESGVKVTGQTTIDAGELVVRSTGILQGGVTGQGTLSVDWSTASGTIDDISSLGELQILSGRYKATSDIQADTIRVKDGGQFWIDDGVTQNGELVVSGNGWTSSNDVAKAGSLRLGNGAVLAGNLTLDSDTSVYVHNHSASITGTINTQEYAFSKLGNGILTLSGSGTYSDVYVQSGTLQLGAGMTLNEGKTMTVASGAVLSLNGQALHGDVTLKNGSIITNDSTETASIMGNIAQDSGSVATMKGGAYNISAANIGVSDSTLVFEGTSLDLSSSNTMINGTLQFNASATLKTSASANNTILTMDHLDIASEKTVTLSSRREANTIWTIHELSGSGNLVWDTKDYGGYTSRLILDGEGDLSGNITFQRCESYSTRVFQSYLELKHDLAAQNAIITLQDSVTGSGNSRSSLTINTEDAHIKGLNSNDRVWLLAGVAPESSASTLAMMPESTRQAKLTITGDGTYDFKGHVSANEGDGYGVTLVMKGTGVQTFSGTSVALMQADIQAGKVVLSGDGSLNQGALVKADGSLQFGSGNSAMTLSANSDPASVNGKVSYHSAGVSIANATMQNVQWTLGSTSNLTLANTSLDAASLIAGVTGSTLNVADLSISMVGNGSGSAETLSAGTRLVSSYTGGATKVLSADAAVLSLDCLSLSHVTVTGTNLTFDLSTVGLLKDLISYDYLSFDFNSAGVDLSGVSNISAQYGDITFEGLWEENETELNRALSSSSTLYFEVTHQNVPEPSAVVFGLFALTATVVRRRRTNA